MKFQTRFPIPTCSLSMLFIMLAPSIFKGPDWNYMTIQIRRQTLSLCKWANWSQMTNLITVMTGFVNCRTLFPTRTSCVTTLTTSWRTCLKLSILLIVGTLVERSLWQIGVLRPWSLWHIRALLVSRLIWPLRIPGPGVIERGAMLMWRHLPISTLWTVTTSFSTSITAGVSSVLVTLAPFTMSLKSNLWARRRFWGGRSYSSCLPRQWYPAAEMAG